MCVYDVYVYMMYMCIHIYIYIYVYMNMCRSCLAAGLGGSATVRPSSRQVAI